MTSVSGSTCPDTTDSPRPQLEVIVTRPVSPKVKSFFLSHFFVQKSPVTGSEVNITPASSDWTISWITTHISVTTSWLCWRLIRIEWRLTFFIIIISTCTPLICRSRVKPSTSRLIAESPSSRSLRAVSHFVQQNSDLYHPHPLHSTSQRLLINMIYRGDSRWFSLEFLPHSPNILIKYCPSLAFNLVSGY